MCWLPSRHPFVDTGYGELLVLKWMLRSQILIYNAPLNALIMFFFGVGLTLEANGSGTFYLDFS